MTSKAGQIGAQLRDLRTRSRQGVFMVVTSSATVEEDRIEVDVSILGDDPDETATAELLGGARTPYGLPVEGELWFGMLLGGDVNRAFLALPLSRRGGVDLGVLAAGVTAWTPPPGDKLQIVTRDGGALDLDVDAAAELDAEQYRFTAAGVSVAVSSAGKVSIGSDAVNGFKTISRLLGWLGDTLTELSTTTVTTLLGPSTLSTAASFATRAPLVIAHKQLFDTLVE